MSSRGRHRRGPTPARGWQPLVRARRVVPDQVREFAELAGVEIPDEMWTNDRYRVIVRRDDDGHVSCISITRWDHKPVHDWRDCHAIKNQLAGPEVEALELYPAESRLVDTANTAWLWVLPPGARLPFGFEDRLVLDADADLQIGQSQRPLASHAAEGDCTTTS